jgi:hypothetical protein
MPRVRVAEVFAALSLTTDLATGIPFEKGLRTCALATAFSRLLGCDDRFRAAVFYTALLRSLGCTAHASENAALFGDDTRFEAAFGRLDLGDGTAPAAQLAGFGSWAPVPGGGWRTRSSRSRWSRDPGRAAPGARWVARWGPGWAWPTRC